LVLNERLASNLRGALDPDFQEAADWIEIVNADRGEWRPRASRFRTSLPRKPCVSFPPSLPGPGEYLGDMGREMKPWASTMHANFKFRRMANAYAYDIRNQRIADLLFFGRKSRCLAARIPVQTGS
jgi:hypothetical protein